MLTIQVNTPALDKQIITTLGTLTLSETLANEDQHAVSFPTLSAASMSISGVATDLSLVLTRAESAAENLMTFTDIPNAYETVTLSGIVYTFIPLASGYTSDHQVHLGTSTFGTALNFHKVLTNTGVSGTDYKSGQAANPYVETRYVSNPLVLRAKTYGVSGNSIETTTTSANIVLAFDKLYNGGQTFPNEVLNETVSWSGLGVYDFSPVPTNINGIPYEGVAQLLYNGEPLVNASGIAVEYTLGRAEFYGKTALNEFVEVPNLSGIWADNGNADSSGEFYVTWDSPSVMYSGVSYGVSAPKTTGTPTQTTTTISTVDSVQPIEYNVFVYTGTSAPERNWPRPVDANGTWYWTGRTSKTYAHLHVPSNAKAVWVGFGNKYTYATTVTNLNQTSTSIYLV